MSLAKGSKIRKKKGEEEQKEEKQKEKSKEKRKFFWHLSYPKKKKQKKEIERGIEKWFSGLSCFFIFFLFSFVLF